MDINFEVDEKKCIHCGLCERICLSKVLELNGDNIPYAKKPKGCIACQHCMAACPVGAISIHGKKPENSDQIYVQNPDMILNLIKSRRSNRLYKSENVDKETLDKLKNMLKWVPTGCNYHKLHFSFIEDIEVMDEFRNYVNSRIVKAITQKPIKTVVEKFEKRANELIEGKDIIFRDAPHMVVVSNPVLAPCAKEDPIIALSYFELYAQSLGLGTCWCGYAEICLNLFPELCEFLKIPNGYKPGYVMLFGPKEVNFARTTQPKDVEIVSITEKTIKDISVLKKIKRCLFNIIR